MRYYLFVIVCFLLVSAQNVLGGNANFILSVNKLDQSAELGFNGYNIVSSVSEYFENKVYEGSVKVYESPECKKRIYPEQFIDLKLKNYPFNQSSEILVYGVQKDNKWELKGIAFLYQKELIKGKEKQSFGFIPLDNKQGRAFMKEYIPVTKYGNFQTTFKSVFDCFQFVFDVVYYNSERIDNANKKLQIANFISKTKNCEESKTSQKLVIKEIAISSDKKSLVSEQIRTDLKNYIRDNPKKYPKTKGLIEKITLTEIWNYEKEKLIGKEVIQLKLLFSDNQKFTWGKDLLKTIMNSEHKSLYDKLLEESYYFNIIQVNNSKIDEQERDFWKLELLNP